MLRVLALIAFVLCTPFAPLYSGEKPDRDFNSVILEQISTMPKGGGYSVKPETLKKLGSSIQTSPSEGLLVNAALVRPSFCSGATYLVFLKTLARLAKDSRITVTPTTWNALLVHSQSDGVGVWGRWNANGPGTACLFHELHLGPNFTDVTQAKPGDFAKLFWTNEVGKFEHGHSVIYLGTEKQNGMEMFRFWSSNIPNGYGEKSVPRKRIALAIFSRLTSPQNIGSRLAPKNEYLASLPNRRSSFQEALSECGAITR